MLLEIVAGDPAEHISDTRKIETVIQDGKVLDRALLKYDPKKETRVSASCRDSSIPSGSAYA